MWEDQRVGQSTGCKLDLEVNCRKMYAFFFLDVYFQTLSYTPSPSRLAFSLHPMSLKGRLCLHVVRDVLTRCKVFLTEPQR